MLPLLMWCLEQFIESYFCLFFHKSNQFCSNCKIFRLIDENLQYLMSSQPIIIQQGVQNTNQKANFGSNDSKTFFELLDQVQNYDNLAVRIKKQYQQAMLLFASIKFHNPFAITPNSHRCLPAYLTIENERNLKTGYVPFTQQVDEDEFPEEFEIQEEIEKQCEIKTEQLVKSDAERHKKLRQNQTLYRFNVLNQQTEVISASRKFEEVLASLLKLAQTKKQLQKTFTGLQKGKA